jgi:hypothetical protein
MTRALPRRWMVPAVAAICVACGGTVLKNGESTPSPSPTTAPTLGPGCPRNAPPSSQKELDACLKTLRFDPDTLAGDEQPLLIIDPQGAPCPGDKSRNCRYGPLARIEPVIGAHQYSETDLSEGRIIAHMFLGPNETEPYRKFGLTQGQDTYWWVQKKGSTGKSVYITTTGSGRLTVVERKLEVYPYSRESRDRNRRALARWIWTLEDETTQGSCGSTSSCR